MDSRTSTRLGRHTFRTLHQDGLLEILTGATFFICSAFLTNPSLLILVVIPALLFVPGLRWLQQRLTFPRVGYAKLVEDDSARQGRGILIFSLIVFSIYVLTLLASGVASDASYWRRWAPALAGALCCGGFLYLASRSSSIRYYLYIATSLLGGIAFSLAEFDRPYENVQMFLLSLAVLMLVSGLLILVRFLHSHPLPPVESNEHI